MVPDWPTTIAAAGVVVASIGAAPGLLGIRRSHNHTKDAEREKKEGKVKDAEKSRKRASEEMELANLIKPWTLWFLFVGILAQVVAAGLILLSKFVV
jgi:hypothetical protein